jgi:alpha-tubulin suppressor-like RCC1 family protein
MKKWSVILGIVIFLLTAWAVFLSFSPESAGPEVPSAMIPPPVVVPLAQSDLPLRVFPGASAALMILPDGSLWQWGRTGPGNWPRLKAPVQVGTNHDWMEAFPANNHCIAVRTNGTLWEWGHLGNAGVGSAVLFSKDPAQVDAGHDWMHIAGGDTHAVGLKRDGSLWAWGGNTRCQLGNGVGPSQYQPVQVGTNRDWTAISSLGAYTLGLRKNGTLWLWGGGFWLGTNKAQADVPVPKQVCRDTNWVGLCRQWALLRHQTIELWNPLFLAPDPDAAASSIGYLMASNWMPNRSALAFGPGLVLFEVRTNGTLWKSPFRFSSGVQQQLNQWRQVGGRSDWVSIWGDGTALGLTSDGTIWTWGSDPGQDPVPFLESRLTLLKVRVLKWLGRPIPSYVTGARLPFQKEPRPLLRLVPATNSPSSSESVPAN